MLPYREVIELRSVGLSYEKVAYLTGCSIQKVRTIVSRAASLGLGWPVPAELSDRELQRLVDEPPPSRFHPIDFDSVSEKAKKGRSRKQAAKKASLQEAWETYLESAKDSGLPPLSRSSFNRQHEAWLRATAKPLYMLVNWTPAEEVQVDWAGRTVPIHGTAGETTPAYLFVATMPYSGYTFVRASLDMSMQSWLEQHRALFEFLGGVPMFLAPDNTATAVKIRNGLRVPMKEKRDINRNYQEMADHYGVIVKPARMCHPQDKGAVEGNVRIAANRFIEFLRQMRFTSIEQLNTAISKLVEIFNDRASSTLMFDVSSKEAFLLYEAPFLAPLPNEPFTSVTWVKAKASPEAVITVRGVYYGLPLYCADKEVRVRISDTSIDVYALDSQQKIAHHARGEDGSHTFEGFAGRRPDRFKPLSEWVEQNGRHALIGQWHPTKNEGLTPEDIVCLSKKKVWWRCDECGYEWQETPRSRISRAWDDCLACANVDLVPGRNDLATLYPEIAAEWHPTKNGCTPSEVLPDQTLNAWWIGAECGHEWLCRINTRTESAFGRLCPYCSGREALPGFNDVKTLCPELAEIWHPWKNRRKKPDTMAVLEYERVFLQKGRFGETWLETPRSWMLRNGYADVLKPFLDRVEKAQEEDRHRKAEITPLDPHAVSRKRIRANRYKRLWAKPMSLEEWCKKNSREQLLKEWHPTKNGPLTPASISHGSGKNVWWLCDKGHEWEDLITHRISAERKCPICFPIREIRPGLTDLSGRTTSFLKYYSPDNKLPADQISSYYNRALKWECPDCGRKWKASIDRFPEQRGSCPFCNKWADKLRCAGLEKLDLASRFPEVAAYWHPTKNDGLQPSEVRPYSTAKAWWLCPDCGQEWQESIKNCMYRKGGLCPFCLDRWADPASESAAESKAPPRKRSSRLIPGYNDLATIEPALAAEWHPTKNGTLTPSDVTPGSTAKVWWLCEKGHEWKAEVKHRSRQGTICPHCASVRRGVNPDRMFFKGKTLATLRPEIIKEWHPTKNGALKLEDIKAGSSRKFWWICEKGHEWEAAACKRSEGTGCPYCSNHRVLAGYNDLATLHPHIAEQWHPTKNGSVRPADVLAGSVKKYWWRCEKGHEWEAGVSARSNGLNCPYCSNKRLLAGYNDLATLHPHIAEQWHPAKNGSLKPSEVFSHSKKEVWWLCPHCGESWFTAIASRTISKGYGCPECTKKRQRKLPPSS